MKKYLQACEIGGSLYGKKKNAGKTSSSRKDKKERDLMGSYTRLYENQVIVMQNVFKSGKA